MTFWVKPDPIGTTNTYILAHATALDTANSHDPTA
jgi:hypothetical protein